MEQIRLAILLEREDAPAISLKPEQRRRLRDLMVEALIAVDRAGRAGEEGSDDGVEGAPAAAARRRLPQGEQGRAAPHAGTDCAESDMWESIISTTAWSPLGARITVTRQFGTVGKCIVNFAITNGAAVMPPFTEPAIPGRHFFPPSRTSLIFDDFEISKSFLIRPIDDGVISAGNPGRIPFDNCASNRIFTVSLTSVALDPGEDSTAIAPPRIDPDHAQAVVNIIVMDGGPALPGNTNGFSCEITNGIEYFRNLI